MSRAQRLLIGLEKVAGVRGTIGGFGDARNRAAPPLGIVKIAVPHGIAVAQVHKQAAPVRHAPPEGRGAAKGRAAAIVVQAHEQSVNPVVEQLHGAGARKSVHIILDGKIGVQELPHIVGKPVEHLAPFIIVEVRRVVEGKGGDGDLPALDGGHQLLAARGRGSLPPIGDRQQRFGGPPEIRVGGARVNRHVDVFLLHLARHRRMIRKPDVHVRQVNDVDALNLRARHGQHCESNQDG